jgi:hypothetical protein
MEVKYGDHVVRKPYNAGDDWDVFDVGAFAFKISYENGVAIEDDVVLLEAYTRFERRIKKQNLKPFPFKVGDQVSYTMKGGDVIVAKIKEISGNQVRIDYYNMYEVDYIKRDYRQFKHTRSHKINSFISEI